MEYLQLEITKGHNGIYKIIGNDSVIVLYLEEE